VVVLRPSEKPATGAVADRLALHVEIQNVAARTQKPPAASPAATLELTITGPGRAVRVYPLGGFWRAFSRLDVPPGNAEQVEIRWFEDYEFFPTPGTYALRLSTLVLAGGRSVTLSSNDVVVTILAALPGNRFVPTPTPSPTGLALSLTAPNAVVALGAPPPAIVEVRNVSREVQYVIFGFRNADYDFEVRDIVTGKVVSQLQERTVSE
jgi:hypothetical protein